MNNTTLSCNEGLPLLHTRIAYYISLKSPLLITTEVFLSCIFEVLCWKPNVKALLLVYGMHARP